MKTTQKDIKNFNAIDITYYKQNELDNLKACEKWFSEVAYSIGAYGCNGLVLQGASSGTLYKITQRTNALFQLI